VPVQPPRHIARAIGGARTGTCQSSGVVRHALDRVIAVVARVLALGFFRRIEVDGESRLPRRGRPTLFTVSHLNGFVDPVVCIAGIRRMPRFIAKRALWKVVPARPLLALVGVVPVERRQDSADTIVEPLVVRGVPPRAGQGARRGDLS
jgi:1-acyl-sn-glycerol-3-phosphate acyltransferase